MQTARWRRITTIMAEIRIVISSARKSPNRRPEPKAAPTVTATPRSATPLAARVVQRSRAPVHSQASPAVMKGAVALMTSTSATVVWRSALTKQMVAAVEQPAARSPGQPIRRRAATSAPLSRQAM